MSIYWKCSLCPQKGRNLVAMTRTLGCYHQKQLLLCLAIRERVSQYNVLWVAKLRVAARISFVNTRATADV